MDALDNIKLHMMEILSPANVGHLESLTCLLDTKLITILIFQISPLFSSLDLGHLGGVSYKDGVICWSTVNKIFCADLVENKLEGKFEILQLGATIGICAGKRVFLPAWDVNGTRNTKLWPIIKHLENLAETYKLVYIVVCQTHPALVKCRDGISVYRYIGYR